MANDCESNEDCCPSSSMHCGKKHLEDGDVRTNGLEGPYHPLQIVTWIFFPLIIIHYFALLYPLLWTNSVAIPILITILFGGACIWTIVAAALCSIVDPADDAYLQKGVNGSNTTFTPDTLYCYECEVIVDNKSKHCRFCNKCVIDLDHHCVWLNTCIGQKNYPYFLQTVSAITIVTIVSYALSVAYLIESFAYPQTFYLRMSIVLPAPSNRPAIVLPLDGVRSLMILSVVVLTPLIVLVFQLCGFHSMLLCKGQTTYEFIAQHKSRKRTPQPEQSTLEDENSHNQGDYPAHQEYMRDWGRRSNLNHHYDRPEWGERPEYRGDLLDVSPPRPLTTMLLPPTAIDTVPPRAGVGATVAMNANTITTNTTTDSNNNNNNTVIDYWTTKNKENPNYRDSEKEITKEFDQYLASSIVGDDDPNGFRSTSSSPQKDAVIFADQDTSMVIDVVPSPSHSFTPSPIYIRRNANTNDTTPLTLTTLKRSNDQATDKIRIQGTP